MGVNLVSQLLEQENIHVKAFFHGGSEAYQRIEKAAQKFANRETHLEIIPINVLHPQSELRKNLADVDVVFHLAAMIQLSQDKQALELMRSVNVDGTRNILEAAHAVGVRKFIHCSSTHAYKHIKGRPLCVSNGLEEPGKLIYDSTKAEAHKLVQDFALDKPNFHYVIVAPSGLVGRGDHSETELWPLLERSKKVRFAPIPNGGYAFVDVRQVAKIMLQSMLQLINPVTLDGINKQELIVGGHLHTIKEMISMMQAITGKSHSLNYFGNRPIVIPLKVLKLTAPLVEKICARIGIKPVVTRYCAEALDLLDFEHGIAPEEYKKLEELFGPELANPTPISLVLEDRYSKSRL